MKRIITLLLPATLLFSACKHEQPVTTKVADDKVPVKLLQLQPEGGMSSISVSGQFTTDDEVNLSFKTGGVVDHIYVKEGDAVKAGQLLAVLKLTEIDAQVQQATIAVEKARRDNARTTNLYKDSVATLEQLQNSKTALDLALQQLDAAKFNRSYSEIRAPKNGFILHKMASEGQVISSGTNVFQTNGAGSAAWLLRVGVSDRQWAAIQLGNKAAIHTDAGDMEGTVSRRSEGVDPATGLFTVDIKLADSRSAALASGMFGRAVITTVKKAATQNVWAIPYEALLDADGSMGYVFVANDDSTVSKVKVSIAGMEKDKVIISDGLQDSKAIVISGSAYLNDKSSIRVIQ